MLEEDISYFSSNKLDRIEESGIWNVNIHEVFSTVLLSLSVLMLIFLCGCLGTEGWSAQDWIEQGNRFAKDGLYTEAVDAYSHSIRLDPINPKVWTYRGIALQHLGRQQEAMNDFDEAIRLNPNESGAWQGKASSYIESGQYKNRP
jgi:tetratricopeptide (TPR) repeat protein